MERTSRVPITRISNGSASSIDDSVVVEEPLEIRIGENPLCVTMRTPGDDFDLATGFLLTEKIVAESSDIESLRHWGSSNVVRVALRDGVRVDLQKLQRHFYATSSCGICGKASIDAIRVNTMALTDAIRVSRAVIERLPDALRGEQIAFETTGAIHAAALFTAQGELVCVREDVGRHNAVDKVIGAIARGGQTPSPVLFVSGRAGFEVVQKAVMGRIPVVAAVGAPSSLAVDLAREFNVTLIGFVREGRFNIYTGEERIAPVSSRHPTS